MVAKVPLNGHFCFVSARKKTTKQNEEVGRKIHLKRRNVSHYLRMFGILLILPHQRIINSQLFRVLKNRRKSHHLKVKVIS